MPRLPYDQIATEANKLYYRATSAPNMKLLKYWYEQYAAFLEAAGWNPLTFQDEELRRVDESWEDPKPKLN